MDNFMDNFSLRKKVIDARRASIALEMTVEASNDPSEIMAAWDEIEVMNLKFIKHLGLLEEKAPNLCKGIMKNL